LAVLGKDTTGDTSYPAVTVGSTNTGTTTDTGGNLMGNSWGFTRMTIKQLGCYSAGVSHAKLGLYNSDLSVLVITEAEIDTVASQWNYRTLATRYYANGNFYLEAEGQGTGALRYTGGAFGLKYKVWTYANPWTTGSFLDSGERIELQAICYRGQGHVLGTRFQAPQAGTVTKVKVYFDTDSSGNFRVAVHADASNHPTTKINESASQAIVAGAWNEITIPSTSIVSGTWYWLVFQFDNVAALPHRDTGVSGDYSFYYGLDYGAFPANLTGLGTVESGTSANLWSIYIPLGATYYQSLPATQVSVAIFIRNIGKSIAATESSAVSLSRAAIFVKALSVIESSVAALTQVLTRTVSLIISEVSSATLSKLATFYRSLSITEVSAASLSKIATFFRALPAVESSIATLSKLATYVRNLSVATAAVSNLFRVSTFLRALSVAELSVASLARKMFQSLSVTAISAATLSVAKVFTRALSVVSTSVAGIQKSITRIVSLVVTETVSLTMSRVSTFYRTLATIETSVASFLRGFFRSLAATEVSTTSLSKIASRFVMFAASAGSIASLTTSRIIVKILSALAGSTASITKAKTFLKVLSVKATGILTLLAKCWGISPLRIYRVPSEDRGLKVSKEERVVKA